MSDVQAKLEIWSGYAMILVPRVMPSGSLGLKLGYDELARLEAQRGELQAVIARERMTANWIRSLFHIITLAMIAGFGVLLFLAE